MSEFYYILVGGSYNSRRSTIEKELSDMLRYDGGRIVRVLKDERILPTMSEHQFRVIVEAEGYTPERWASFLLRVRDITKRVEAEGLNAIQADAFRK